MTHVVVLRDAQAGRAVVPSFTAQPVIDAPFAENVEGVMVMGVLTVPILPEEFE
jgi:hypothetical protein